MKILIITICLVCLVIGGCSAGSGYALKSGTASDLTPAARERISEEIKNDLKLWLKTEMSKQE